MLLRELNCGGAAGWGVGDDEFEPDIWHESAADFVSSLDRFKLHSMCVCVPCVCARAGVCLGVCACVPRLRKFVILEYLFVCYDTFVGANHNHCISLARSVGRSGQQSGSWRAWCARTRDTACLPAKVELFRLRHLSVPLATCDTAYGEYRGCAACSSLVNLGAAGSRSFAPSWHAKVVRCECNSIANQRKWRS